ncbi:Fc receptor-like protein 5 isoform X1 [Manis pentadactyla]|uniref:Fc receptor-like protein 5 isoform X1 n=1 Tax=Manis pentadactyla TaxID=143292 RepID=UPI00255CF680|nr:Fc receptor-like protein 5 isoform X1 [Manis pentadactyla]
MLPWVSLLVLAPISGQLEATPKSVISLRPPWTVVFKGEKVTLTCNGFHLRTSQKTTWHREHHGRKELHETLGNTLEVQEPGEYRCQVQGSLLSSRVALLFSQALLILGAPFAVFEGDPVVLQCRVKREAALETLHLHKNGKPMYTSGKIPDVYIPHASLKDNGAYHCTGVKKDDSPVSSNTVKIQVQELFPQPVLKASPSWPTEGGPLTLTCQTQLAPQRSDVQLWFRFFRDGQTLGSRWSNSPEFQITAVWSRDSRSYWCQAKRVTSRAGKTSQELQINVKIPVSQPVLTLSPPGAQAAEGEVVTLHCKVPRGSFPITYQLYHEGVPLKKEEGSAQRAMPFRLPLTAERSGHYFCSADNGFGPRCSEAVGLSVIVPVSRPVLTLRAPGAQAVVGDVLELRCEAQRGSPPILYRFYHEDVALGSSSAPSGGGASINLSLTAEHSGNYSCEADNALRTQRSNTVSLSVTVPVSRPVLTLGAPGAQAAVGDVVELRCEAHRGSPPILYRFYHEDVALESSSAPLGRGVSINLSLTAEHSGNYSCEADNVLGAQRSEVVTFCVIVPVSRPVLTLGAPGAQAAVGDVLELRCEAQRGSPPILYRFYHEGVALESSSTPSGGGASFNLSLTADHSGNFSCEADNGLGSQRSEAVPLKVTGLTANRSGLTATGVAGGLVSLAGLAALALVSYCRLSGKAGGRPTSGPSRSSSDSNSQEPTYHNVPGWVEMQPVYSNVNPQQGEVIYSEVRGIQKKNSHAAASSAPGLQSKDSSVIYAQVKRASAPACRPQLLASSAPHR